MKKFWIQIITMIIISGVALALTFNSQFKLDNFVNSPAGSGLTLQTTQLTIDGTNITVEVADTPEKRAQGLSGRGFLAQDSGMLFVFDKADKYRFWMKDMKFPLDFIWINGNTVVDLLPNVPPPDPGTALSSLPVYGPVTAVDKVLEVNSGFIASHSIKVGDSVSTVQGP